jgi:hypothetical protein
MEAEALLREITDYCRRKAVAESTFGRHAVNDGKFVNRLREGGRITTATFERVRSFIAAGAAAVGAAAVGAAAVGAASGNAAAGDATSGEGSRRRRGSQPGRRPGATPAALAGQPAPAAAPGDRNFRFFDNRQYLMFVNTCSEKAVVAQRVAMELANIHPRPPAVRVFDAGVGDATVLTRVMRRCTTASRRCPSILSARKSASKTCALRWRKCRTVISSIHRPCW